MNSTVATVSGSTDRPVRDGIARGATVTAVLAAISFGARRLGMELTPEDIGDLMLFLPLVLFGLAGLWDRFVKPKA